MNSPTTIKSPIGLKIYWNWGQVCERVKWYSQCMSQHWVFIDLILHHVFTWVSLRLVSRESSKHLTTNSKLLKEKKCTYSLKDCQPLMWKGVLFNLRWKTSNASMLFTPKEIWHKSFKGNCIYMPGNRV